jgi:beta-lactamase regulating signal transducer with metallopeptidase domain
MMQHALIAYLVNAAWQAPLIAVVAVVVSRLAGLAPRSRNLVWLGFLILAIVVPALAVDWTPASPAPVPNSSVTAYPPEAIPQSGSASANLERADPLRLLRIELDARSSSAIRLAFVTAAAIALARLALAGAGAQRLVRESRQMIVPDQLAEAMSAFAHLHHATIPAVRRSASISSPVVVGALMPVILVPARFNELAAEDQRAALLHEMAHVIRRDYAVNLASEVATVPLSWHPAVHAIKAGVRRTRELACDAMASAAMDSEETYARCLLSLARSLGAPARGAPEAGMVGLFGRSDLEERLDQMLRPKSSQDGGLKVVRLGGAAAISAVALTPAALFHVTPALAASNPQAAAAAPASPAELPRSAAPSPADDASDAAMRAANEADHDAAPKARVRVHRHDGAPTHEPSAQTPGISAPEQPIVAATAPVDLVPAVMPITSVAEVSRHPITDVLISSDGPDVSLADVDSARRVADEQRRKWEAQVRCALHRTEAAERAQSSTLRRQLSDVVARQTRLASLNRDQIRKQLDAARAAINDARVKEALAQAQERVASAAMRESRIEAANIRRELERAMREASRARADEDSARTEL